VPEPSAPPCTHPVSDVLFLKGLLHERKRPLGRHEHGWEIEIRMKFAGMWWHVDVREEPAAFTSSVDGWLIYLHDWSSRFLWNVSEPLPEYAPSHSWYSSLQSYNYENHISHSLLKWILKKLDYIVWAGFVLLDIGAGVRLL